MKSKNGFTLIEVLIVVAIISILVAIAIPAFVQNSRKAEMKRAGIPEEQHGLYLQMSAGEYKQALEHHQSKVNVMWVVELEGGDKVISTSEPRVLSDGWVEVTEKDRASVSKYRGAKSITTVTESY